MAGILIDVKDLRRILALQEDIVAIYPHTDSVKYAEEVIEIIRKTLGLGGTSSND